MLCSILTIANCCSIKKPSQCYDCFDCPQPLNVSSKDVKIENCDDSWDKGCEVRLNLQFHMIAQISILDKKRSRW